MITDLEESWLASLKYLHAYIYILVTMKEEETSWRNYLTGQQEKVLYSREKCLAANSVSPTVYGLMYLRITLCRLVMVLWFIWNLKKHFLYFKFKTRTQSKDFDLKVTALKSIILYSIFLCPAHFWFAGWNIILREQVTITLFLPHVHFYFSVI